MTRRAPLVLLMLLAAGVLTTTAGASLPGDDESLPPQAARGGPSSAALPQGAGNSVQRQILVTVRPATLADYIGQLAGHAVHVPYARVVRMYGTRVLVVDTVTRLSPVLDHRNRVLVLVDEGAIRVPPELLIGSTVRVVGVARTLLGMQVTREVPWPDELDRARLGRLRIRAAVLATSVQTPEGVELTDRLPAPVPPA